MTTVTSMASPTVTSLGSGSYSIVGTIPDSPQKNKLQRGKIKVKNSSTGEKAWSHYYTISNTGVEDGFFWGFPDVIAPSPTITQGITSNVAGQQTFSITAPGLHAFKKCSGAVVYPTIYAADTDWDDNANKVTIQQDKYTTGQNPANNVWTSQWSGDGAPTVCTTATPCINLTQPYNVTLLNPGNVTSGGTYNSPKPKFNALAVLSANQVSFTSATSSPSFNPGTGYGPTNSVGYGLDANQAAVNIAVRPSMAPPITSPSTEPISIASNTSRAMITGPGSSIIPPITPRTTRRARPLATQPGGKAFTAWAPAHAPGQATPWYGTKEDGDATTPSSASFTVKPSIALAPYSTSCVTSGGTCGASQPANGSTNRIESFLVGPGEAQSVTAGVGTCTASQGSCSDFSLTTSVVIGTADGQGRVPVEIWATGTYSGSGGPYSGERKLCRNHFFGLWNHRQDQRQSLALSITSPGRHLPARELHRRLPYASSRDKASDCKYSPTRTPATLCPGAMDPLLL